MTLGVLANTHLRTIKGTAPRITEDAIPRLYLIGTLQDATLLRYTLLTDHVDADDTTAKAELDGQIDSANGEIDDVMSKYEKRIVDPGDRQLFENIKSVRTLYTESHIRVLRLSREGKREEALGVIRTQLIPLRDAFLNAAEVEVMWNKADADAAHGIMAAMNWNSTGILICFVLGVGIAGIFLETRKRLRAERNLSNGAEIRAAPAIPSEWSMKTRKVMCDSSRHRQRVPILVVHASADVGRLIEHDRLVAITENSVLQMPHYGPRQHSPLDIPTLLYEIFHLIPMRNSHHVLFDDRAVVQCCRHIVARRADQFYPSCECHMIRPGAFEGRQKE